MSPLPPKTPSLQYRSYADKAVPLPKEQQASLEASKSKMLGSAGMKSVSTRRPFSQSSNRRHAKKVVTKPAKAEPEKDFKAAVDRRRQIPANVTSKGSKSPKEKSTHQERDHSDKGKSGKGDADHYKLKNDKRRQRAAQLKARHEAKVQNRMRLRRDGPAFGR